MKQIKNNPPPLAPLSSSSTSAIIKQIPGDMSDDIPKKEMSQKITANKMLADLLEKKSLEPPPAFTITTNENMLKRKIENDESVVGLPPVKRNDMDNKDECALEFLMKENEIIMPSTKAADLYAELAGSILEDEDLEDEKPTVSVQAPAPVITINQTPQTIIQQTIAKQPVSQQMVTQQHIHQQSSPVSQKTNQVITLPVPLQRQIIVTPNNQQQMILSSGSNTAQHMIQKTATIKTESGYQTVPVILQHSNQPNQLPNNYQIQKQIGPGGQIMQPTVISAPQQQTQYILATNQQGQTYVVAQQPQQQMKQQTVLLAQTSQQHGTGAQTIIILQHQPQTGQTTMQPSGMMGTPQKLYMTQQGQQVILTQVPRPMQHQVIVNHPISTSNNMISIGNNNIFHNTQASQGMEKKIILTNSNIDSNVNDFHQKVIQHQQQHQQQQSQPIQVQATQQIAPNQSQHIVKQHMVSQQSGTQMQISQQPIVVVAQAQQNPTQHSTHANTQSGVIQIQKQVDGTAPITQTQSKPIIIQQQQQIQHQPSQMQVQQQVQHQPTQQIQHVQIQQQSQIQHHQQQMQVQTHQQAQVQQQQIQGQNQIQLQMQQQQPLLVPAQQQPQVQVQQQSQVQVQHQQQTQPVQQSQTCQVQQQQSQSQSHQTVVQQPQQNVSTCSNNVTTVPTSTTTVGTPSPTSNANTSSTTQLIKMIPAMDPSKIVEEDVDINWLWVCDWRGCPKYVVIKLYHHFFLINNFLQFQEKIQVC